MKRGGSPKLNLEPCTTAVSSPQSNGMAERFVKNDEGRLYRVHAETGCENSPAKLQRRSRITMKITRIVRWDITLENTGSGHR
jgi:transposase InsO family protein